LTGYRALPVHPLRLRPYPRRRGGRVRNRLHGFVAPRG
jgi:hypothetical protein